MKIWKLTKERIGESGMAVEYYRHADSARRSGAAFAGSDFRRDELTAVSPDGKRIAYIDTIEVL